MNYELTILSPVHIGTGKKMNPFEFVCVNNVFVVMDLEKLFAANPSRADDLHHTLDREKIRFSLSDFLTADEKNNTSFWTYSAALDRSAREMGLPVHTLASRAEVGLGMLRFSWLRPSSSKA